MDAKITPCEEKPSLTIFVGSFSCIFLYTAKAFSYLEEKVDLLQQ